MKNKLFSFMGIGLLVLISIFSLGVRDAQAAAIEGIAVSAPNGAEKWNGTKNIEWTTVPAGPGAETVSIYYCTGINCGANAYTLIAAGEVNDGLYPWVTTTAADGDAITYKIRIEADADPTIADISDNVFTVDNTKPTVLTTAITPNPARDGEVSVTLTFSELMKETVDPVVTVTGLTVNPYTLTKDTYTGNTYVGHFELSDSNENGTGTVNFADAQDLATNVIVTATGTPTLTVDTVHPTLTGVVWDDVDHSTAISGTDTLTLTFSELMNPSSLTIASPVTLATELTLSAGIFGATGFNAAWGPTNATLTITLGNETTILSGATLDPIGGTATDVIGNAAVTTSRAITDNVKPTVLTTAITPNPARDGEVSVTLTFSELMKETVDPVVTVTGLTVNPYTLTKDTYTGNTYVGHFELSDSNENGTGTVNFADAQDLATNVIVTATGTPTLTVDTVHPTLTGVVWDDVDHSTAISGTDTLTLTFSELMNPSSLTIASPVTLATELTLSAGIFGATGFNAAWGPTNATLTITLGNETTILSGATLDPIGGTATDVIGNAAVTTSRAITDNVKPTVLTTAITPNPARDGEVSVTLTFSELMKETVDPVVTVTGLTVNPYTLTKDTYTGNTYVGHFELSDSNENGTGTVNFADAQDLATNVIVTATGTPTLTVDTVHPTLTGVVWDDVDHSTAISGTDTLTLTFSELMNPSSLTIASPVTLATELTLSAGIFGATGFNAAWGPTNATLTITLGNETTILSGATLDPIGGTATDVIGNAAVTTSRAITDNVKPTVLTTAITPNPARDGEVSVTLTFSELMKETVDPVVTVTGLTVNPYTLTKDTYTGNTYVGHFELSDSNENGTGTVNFADAQDLATNVIVTATGTPTLTVDTVHPTLTGVVWDDVDHSTAISGTDTLTLTFSELMNPSSLTIASPVTLATELTLSAGIFGATGFNAAWGPTNATLTITLGNETTILSGATLDPIGGTATDVIGNAAVTTSRAITDNVKPTLRGARVTGDNEITIVYSEPVISVMGDYTNLHPYAIGDRGVTAAVGTGTDTIVLTFNGDPLSITTTATIDIGATVTDLATNTLIAIVGQNVAAAGADVTAPTVEALLAPTSNTNVSIDTEVVIRFSEIIDVGTLSGKVHLWDNTNSEEITLNILNNGVDPTNSKTIVGLRNASLLLPETEYYVIVDAGVKDVAGNGLALHWDSAIFTTAATDPGSLTIDYTGIVGTGIARNHDDWTDGWTFDIDATIPTGNTGIKMIFDNWKQSGTTAINAANNFRFSVDGGATHLDITAAANAAWDNWSGWLDISGATDNNIDRPGKQITIRVETKIPGTVTIGGSYTAAFALDSGTYIAP